MDKTNPVFTLAQGFSHTLARSGCLLLCKKSFDVAPTGFVQTVQTLTGHGQETIIKKTPPQHSYC
jgi:hypothetical protein